MSLAWRFKGLESEMPGVELPDFLLWENSLDHSEHEFFSFCFPANWVKFGVITDLAYFLRLLWFSNEIEQQVAEWLWDDVDLGRLWRHEGYTVAVSFHFCHDHTAPWMEGFLIELLPPGLQTCLYLYSSPLHTLALTALLNESQETIGGAGSFRVSRITRSWPRGHTVCRVSQSGSVCPRVRSSDWDPPGEGSFFVLRTGSKPGAAACWIGRKGF